MKNLHKISPTIILITIFLISSALTCRRYEIGHFEETVVNFTDVNTIWDDYNSTSPSFENDYLFHFSSNRNSYGAEFDIVGENMQISWNMETGALGVTSDPYGDYMSTLHPLFEAINSPNNELGPYSFLYTKDSENNITQDLVMYTSDESGDFDLKYSFVDFYSYNLSRLTDTVKTYNLNFLNTDANEMYPSFFGEDFYYHNRRTPSTEMIQKIIYCSDKDGDYDIYAVDFSPGYSIVENLQANPTVEPLKMDISSESEDKCPNVNGKLLVFSSNRPGGYGGFDLYYSLYENGNWSKPLNFGNKINTEYDEYRPIVIQIFSFDNSVMVFSSNRPGGKGGFDLYYTGIENMIE